MKRSVAYVRALRANVVWRYNAQILCWLYLYSTLRVTMRYDLLSPTGSTTRVGFSAFGLLSMMALSCLRKNARLSAITRRGGTCWNLGGIWKEEGAHLIYPSCEGAPSLVKVLTCFLSLDRQSAIRRDNRWVSSLVTVRTQLSWSLTLRPLLQIC